MRRCPRAGDEPAGVGLAAAFPHAAVPPQSAAAGIRTPDACASPVEVSTLRGSAADRRPSSERREQLEVRWQPEWALQSSAASLPPRLVLSSCPAAAAPPVVPLHKTNGPSKRATSASPQRRRRRGEVSNNHNARRAKTPTHRRVGGPPSSPKPLGAPPQLKARATALAASTCSAAAADARGQAAGFSRATSPLPGARDASASGCGAEEVLYLRQQRTWRLLKHIVDEVEYWRQEQAADGTPECLPQEVRVLEQLLEPLMRLLPLKGVIGELAVEGPPLLAAQGPPFSPLESPSRVSGRKKQPAANEPSRDPPPRSSSPQLPRKRSTARLKLGRVLSASSSSLVTANESASGFSSSGGKGSLSFSPAVRRPAAASPSRSRSPAAARTSGEEGTLQERLPDAGLEGGPSSKAGARGPSSGAKLLGCRRSIAASRQPEAERRKGQSSPSSRLQPSRPSEGPRPPKPAGPGGLIGAPWWLERPWGGRAASTGKWAPLPRWHAVSRLPPSAIVQRRPPKPRARPASPPEKQQQQQQIVGACDWVGAVSCESWGAEPPNSYRSAESGDTLNAAVSLESMQAAAAEGALLAGRESAAAEWLVSRDSGLNPDFNFRCISSVGASPPSLPSGRGQSEGGTSPGSSEEGLQLRLRGRGSAESSGPGSQTAAEREARPPPSVSTASPSPRSPRGHRLPETRHSPGRRHQSANPRLLTAHSVEGERLQRRQQQQRPHHENAGWGVAGMKRDRRVTVAEAMKHKGLALNARAAAAAGSPRGGHEEEEAAAGEAGGTDSPCSQPSDQLSLSASLRAREGWIPKESRRATVHASRSPHSAASSSPRGPLHSAKAKAERGAPHHPQKTLVKKKSSSSVGKVGSSLVLQGSGVSGRRVSAPPPRKASQTKLLPSTPPRSRQSVSGVGGGAARAGTSSPPVKSSSVKKRTVKGKAKGNSKEAEVTADRASEASAGGPPDHDEDVSEARGDSHPKEEAQTVEEESPPPPEEPPYPYLRLAELPQLDEPLRPLPDLESLHLKTKTANPPPLDDKVTFMHVLGRADCATEKARDSAIKEAVANLSSDAPSTLLLIARWMDSSADTMENTTAVAKEQFPWRQVVPPLFVAPATHRELLSPRGGSSCRTVEDLKVFFESEGFVQTQEEKLRQLLADKGDLYVQPLAEDDKPKEIEPTELDIYLDRLLAVALWYLWLRQQPLVQTKVWSPLVGAAAAEAGSPFCCSEACFLGDRSLAGTDAGASSVSGGSLESNEEQTGRRGHSPPRYFYLEEGPELQQRRSWSCLPLSGFQKELLFSPEASRQQAVRSCRRSSLLPGLCLPSSGEASESEEFILDSAAAQQVRCAVGRMPLLPSEKYLRFLRLLGRRRELESLAVWLAGGADALPPPPKQQPPSPPPPPATATGEGGGLEGVAVEAGGTAPASSSPLSPAGDASNGISPSAGEQQPSLLSGTELAAAALSLKEEKECELASGQQRDSPRKASGESKPKGGEDAAAASACGTRQAAAEGAEEALSSPAPARGSQAAGRTQLLAKALGAAAAVGGPPAEPHPSKKEGDSAGPLVQASASLGGAAGASAAKAKTKKAQLAKHAKLRPTDKGGAGGGPGGPPPSVSAAGGVKQTPKCVPHKLLAKGSSLSSPSASFQGDGEAAEAEAVRLAASFSFSKAEASSLHGKSPLASFHKKAAALPSPLRRAGSSASSRQQLASHLNSASRPSLEGRRLTHGGPSPKHNLGGPPFRRAAPTMTPNKAAAGGSSNTHGLAAATRQSAELRREAKKLLTEPQMLAEVASLCARLSALGCCRESSATASKTAGEQPAESASETGEEAEPQGFIELTR
ncbi:hypothetical protein Efla_003119 [Eimeria flavescens]